MPSVAPTTPVVRPNSIVPTTQSSLQGSAFGGAGGFQDFMSAFIASLTAAANSASANGQAATPTGANGTSSPSGKSPFSIGDLTSVLNAVAASDGSATTVTSTQVANALQTAQLTHTDVTSVLVNLLKGQTAGPKTGSTAKTTDPQDDIDAAAAQASAAQAALAGGAGVVGTVVGQAATQPLQFAADPGSILSAAGQAIAALAGQSTSNATANVAAPVATGAIDATAASQQLAQEGVVSVTGQVATQEATAQAAANAAAVSTAAAAAAAANQPSASNTPSGPTPEQVAIASIQQRTTNMPMTRMSEIRAKLQAVQLNASRGTPAIGTIATSLEPTANPNGLQTGQSGAALPSSPATGLLAQQLASAATAAAVPGSKDLQTAADPSSADPSSTSASSTTPDPSLAGLNQTPTQQPAAPTEANPQLQAVPYTALASTLVSHAKAGNSEFSIRLDPAGLGQIDVRMKVSSDGEVRAHMIVDQPATLDLMMRDRQQLQQSLDQAGFKTDPSSLQFSLRDQGQNQGQQQQSSQGQSNQSASSAAASADPTPAQTTVYTRQSYIRSDAVDVSV